TGLGTELRRPPGIPTVGGPLSPPLVTRYTPPVIYLAMERSSEWLRPRRVQRARRGATALGRAGSSPAGSSAARAAA
ncbi:hypothetical protein, partial [Stenotrophomonas sp. SrG]|uniref:hypothetical protein n=1 Tax=Stenotrophomonas sp. SrG TaxID=3414430 RepID=UPI003CEE33BA